MEHFSVCICTTCILSIDSTIKTKLASLFLSSKFPLLLTLESPWQGHKLGINLHFQLLAKIHHPHKQGHINSVVLLVYHCCHLWTLEISILLNHHGKAKLGINLHFKLLAKIHHPHKQGHIHFSCTIGISLASSLDFGIDFYTSSSYSSTINKP